MRSGGGELGTQLLGAGGCTPTSAQEGILLTVDGLRVSTTGSPRSVELLHGVSFQVPLGARVAMVGESGSGKSLTAMTVMGLLPEGVVRTAGSIRLAGTELTQLRSRELQRLRGREVSMIYQNAVGSLNPLFSVGDQIASVCRTHLGLSRKQARQRAVEMLEALGVPEPARRYHDYPHQFSGGMAQRVAIAMALACSPRLLIADEPTTGLDATIQLQVLEAIEVGLRESGAALLLISHDLAAVRWISEWVVVLYAGMVLETGPTEAVLRHPLSPYTKGLIACIDPPVGSIAYIPGRVPEPGSIGEQCPFAPRCEHASEICWLERPLLRSYAGQRAVACHHAEL
jgi:oligopeptide/dipeptide ABC transporter ATP-binding protein